MTSTEEFMDSRAVVPDGVVQRKFEAETLLLNLTTGGYHGVNETGGRLLELLAETGGEVRAAVDRLALESGVDPGDVAGELADFCRELVRRGLLEVRPA